MKDSDKKLVRAFYQGLATEEEKAAFRNALTLKDKERRAEISRLIALNVPMNMEMQAIILMSDLSREELVTLFAAEVRAGILSRIGAWLRLGWSALFGGRVK